MDETMIDYEALDPGIRETVRWLNAEGFETSDSGDGHSKRDMECAQPFPHVAVPIMPELLVKGADLLRELLASRGITLSAIGGENPCIQASYDPAAGGSAFIVLMNVDDSLLRGAKR